MGTMTRRLAVGLAAVAMLASVAGCSKDETVSSTATTTPVTLSSGGGGGTTTTEPDADDPTTTEAGGGEYDDACSAIEEIDQFEGDGELEAGLALFAAARDAGPKDLADHWDTLADVYEEVAAIDEDDPEALARSLELLEDPEFLEAAAAIDDFAEEECGLDIGLDPTEERDVPGGRNDPEIDPTDTSIDDDPTSIDAVQAHLAEEYDGQPWLAAMEDATSWGSTGTGGDVEWEIILAEADSTMSLPMLLAACDAVSDYLDTYEGDVSVAIKGADETILVARGPRELCTQP